MYFIIRVPQSHIPRGTTYTKNEKISLRSSLTSKANDSITIDVADELSISPKDIFKYLSVNLGDVLEEGALLAQKKGLLHSTTLNSPLQGEVRSIDHTTGTVTLIRSITHKDEFLLEGEYEGCEHDDVLLKVREGMTTDVDFAVHRTFGGEVSYVNNFESVTIETCTDKVLVSPAHSSIDLAKASSLDPIALVVGEISYYSTTLPVIKIKPEQLREVIKKQYHKCIYFSDDKVIYWYATHNESKK